MRKEYDFTRLKKAEPKYLKHLKRPVTMRLDPDVIRHFKRLAEKTGIPYQSLMNYVLKDYASLGLEPTANWGAGVGRRVQTPGGASGRARNQRSS